LRLRPVRRAWHIDWSQIPEKTLQQGLPVAGSGSSESHGGGWKWDIATSGAWPGQSVFAMPRIARGTSPDPTLTFGYDSGCNLSTARTSGGGTGQPNVTLAYSYNQTHDRLSMTDSLGTVGRTTYAYSSFAATEGGDRMVLALVTRGCEGSGASSWTRSLPSIATRSAARSPS
jgi:hypothetical protein